jgi:predicted ATPase
LVGRDHELQKLHGFLRQSLNGSGRIVFLTGEPGIGKTALAEEFLRRACHEHPAPLVGRGRCVEQYGNGEAYLPFLDAVSSLLAGPHRQTVIETLRTYAPTWCLQFPAAFPSSGALDQLQRETMGATKERMLRELGDALEAVARERPVVLLLEDLHWADASSADLLRHLCQRIGAQSVLLLATFRPEDLESGSHPLKNYRREMQAHRLCEEIALGMLKLDHVIGYLNVRFSPNNFPPEFAAVMQAKTDGLPLFARSLLEFLADRGDIVKVNECWTLARPVSDLGLEVPASVRSMIRAAVDALSEDDRRALQYASVAGEEFLSTVLANLLGVDELTLEERLDELDKLHHLIQTLDEEELPDGSLATRYRFAHSLYKDVLYSDLVHKRRILLHREAGEHLLKQYGKQARSIAVQLALHFELGRDFGRAIEHHIQAGDNATRLYATGEAEQHYSRAMGLIERMPPEEQPRRYITICQKRGEANLTLSRFAQAADDFKSTLQRARDVGAAPEESLALNYLAKTYLFSHRVVDLAVCVEEILPTAERSGNRARCIEALEGIALKHLCFGELSTAKPLLDESIASARQPGIAKPSWRP